MLEWSFDASIRCILSAFRTIRCQSWLIGLVLATGCTCSQTDIRDRLVQRITPVEVDAGQSTSPADAKASGGAWKDTKVRLADASQPGQGIDIRKAIDGSTPLPAALEGSPTRDEPRPPPAPATPLPSDGDEAALDAIAAAGKPMTLPEAITLAFRHQPRCSPARKHRTGPRAAADRVFDVPAHRCCRITTSVT